jgi:hypothetical protein
MIAFLHMVEPRGPGGVPVGPTPQNRRSQAARNSDFSSMPLFSKIYNSVVPPAKKFAEQASIRSLAATAAGPNPTMAILRRAEA